MWFLTKANQSILSPAEVYEYLTEGVDSTGFWGYLEKIENLQDD